MDKEQWRDIPGYEGIYQVSNLGSIRNIKVKKAPKSLTSFLTAQGYLGVGLKYIGRKTFTVHRLVMLAFIGECPAGHEVNHINGIKTDNRLSNLEYITHSQNMRHSVDVLNNRSARGEESGRAKLTNQDVQFIRDALSRGESRRALGRHYGVHHRTICNIEHGLTWRESRTDTGDDE